MWGSVRPQVPSPRVWPVSTSWRGFPLERLRVENGEFSRKAKKKKMRELNRMSWLNAKTLKALVSQIAYNWAFLFQAGDWRPSEGSQSMVACPFRDFWQCLEKNLVLASQLLRVGMLLSILKIHRLAPHNKELCGIKCPQCWVWETAPRQWLSKCGPQINSIFTNWELDRNANSPRHLYGSTESQTLGRVWQTVGVEGVKEVKLSLLF